MSDVQVPTLETERLILRAWRAEDLAWMAEVYANEDHARFIGGKKKDWEAWRTLAGIIGHWQLRGFGPFVIALGENEEALGWAGPWFPHGWPEPEISYTLHPSAVGHGYAREAASAALAHAYQSLGWKTAISLIDANNEGSKRVASALGAHFERNEPIFDTETGEVWRHLPPEQFLERAA